MVAALLMAAAAPDAEIVVLAQRLRNTRFVWKATDKSGAWTLTRCKIRQSSGDADVDALACQALTRCLPTLPLAAKQPPPEFHACVTEQRQVLIADLAARRAAAADVAP